jgi:hypothetical protein
MPGTRKLIDAPKNEPRKPTNKMVCRPRRARTYRHAARYCATHRASVWIVAIARGWRTERIAR